MTSKNHPPREDDAELPVAWSHLLEKEIAGYFEDDVADLFFVREMHIVTSKKLTK